jgi:murein DD-endopeptidase MepM/ murein hydrolase activator NlpD
MIKIPRDFHWWIGGIIGALLLLILAFFLRWGWIDVLPDKDISTPASQNNTNATNLPKVALALPTNSFYERVTKKPFGLRVSPTNSPVNPEKFNGYHTGADAEYEDILEDVPVFAISDGTVLEARTVSGYGGVMVFVFTINNQPQIVLYGHLRPSSMLPVGSAVKIKEQVAILGTGYSSETDGERKHLHISIRSDQAISYIGYVPNQEDLQGWLDPVEFLKNNGA